MGICWNCNSEVILKEEETRCDRCKEIVRYWCNCCKQPFDVQDKKNKKLKECKWCYFFICPNCFTCSPTCSKYKHKEIIRKYLNGLIPINKYGELDKASQKIIDYFEKIKNTLDKTTCSFGVPKTYAKEKIKGILARMNGFKTKSKSDQLAFEERYEETLDKPLGFKYTIKQVREDGSYGQEYRDVFNLCVCLGKLKYKKEKFKNEKGIEIEFDSWTRVEDGSCPNFDDKELIVGYCINCKGVFLKDETYCNKCFYKKASKQHKKGERRMLIQKLSNNPTCKNLGGFKKRDGESRHSRNT